MLRITILGNARELERQGFLWHAQMVLDSRSGRVFCGIHKEFRVRLENEGPVSSEGRKQIERRDEFGHFIHQFENNHGSDYEKESES
jgi:hypothetical protein